MIPAARGARAAGVLTGLSLAASLVVLGLYAAHVLVLVRYPFDWSPDEGLSLDYARRLLEAPATLYARSVTPFPSAYGPLLPAVLAPVVWLAGEPLAPARLLALGWTALGALAVFLLVRPVASPALALASCALALAPFDLTFWHVLVRVDGLMVALWLLAAVPLLARLGNAGARTALRAAHRARQRAPAARLPRQGDGGSARAAPGARPVARGPAERVEAVGDARGHRGGHRRPPPVGDRRRLRLGDPPLGRPRRRTGTAKR